MLALATHILKLELYREDYHGPCARMIHKFVKRSIFFSILTLTEFRKMVTITLYAKKKKETQMYRTDLWTLREKARVGCLERTASKHVYYLG